MWTPTVIEINRLSPHRRETAPASLPAAETPRGERTVQSARADRARPAPPPRRPAGGPTVTPSGRRPVHDAHAWQRALVVASLIARPRNVAGYR